MNDLQFDIASFVFFFVMGFFVTWWLMAPKRKVVITEEIVKVARCGSCNKLRVTLQKELDDWYELGHGQHTRPPYPTVTLKGSDGKRKPHIHWELLDLERKIGQKPKK